MCKSPLCVSLSLYSKGWFGANEGLNRAHTLHRICSARLLSECTTTLRLQVEEQKRRENMIRVHTCVIIVKWVCVCVWVWVRAVWWRLIDKFAGRFSFNDRATNSLTRCDSLLCSRWFCMEIGDPTSRSSFLACMQMGEVHAYTPSFVHPHIAAIAAPNQSPRQGDTNYSMPRITPQHFRP